jgi:hypothetical protein
VLLVDYHKAQAAVFHVLRKKGVGSGGNVDFPGGKGFQQLRPPGVL